MTIKALVIPVGSTGEIREIEPNLETLSQIVGGWIENVSVGGDWHAYCDEEGKIKQSSGNEAATIIAYKLGWPTRDILCGDVVFLGEDPRDSAEEGDVPQSVLDAWEWYLERSVKEE